MSDIGGSMGGSGEGGLSDARSTGGGRTTDAETAFGSDSGEDDGFGDGEYDDDDRHSDGGSFLRGGGGVNREEEDSEDALEAIEERVLLQQRGVGGGVGASAASSSPDEGDYDDGTGGEREFNDNDYATGFESGGGVGFGYGGISSSGFATDGTNEANDEEDESHYGGGGAAGAESGASHSDSGSVGSLSGPSGAAGGDGISAATPSGAEGSSSAGAGARAGGDVASAHDKDKSGGWLSGISGYFFGKEKEATPDPEPFVPPGSIPPPSDAQLGGVATPPTFSARRRSSTRLRARYVPTSADFGAP